MVILVAKLMMMKILLEVVVMMLTVRLGWERCVVYTVYCEVLESEQSILINTVKTINVDIDSYGDDNSHDDDGNGERKDKCTNRSIRLSSPVFPANEYFIIHYHHMLVLTSIVR